MPAEALAASVGRGRRSAVGTHGFLHGGLIVDAGKESGQTLGTLSERVAVPDDWRFVLVTKGSQRGLSGETEADAFTRLPPVPGEVTQELWRLTDDEMLPAVKRADCAAFGEAVYHFGRFAGECFAAVQGGPFASDEIGRLVDAIRDHGVDGVGQSSWGPTVFAIVPNEAEASGYWPIGCTPTCDCRAMHHDRTGEQLRRRDSLSRRKPVAEVAGCHWPCQCFPRSLAGRRLKQALKQPKPFP